jgi:histone H2A
MPKSKKHNPNNFDIYISRVLKQVGPTTHISENVKSQINYFLNLLAVKIIKEAVFLVSGQMYHAKSNKPEKKTIQPREIQTAIRIIFGDNPEICKHAVSEGTKAVAKYTNSLLPKGTMKNVKSGLMFPVFKVENIIRNNYKGNVAELSAIYLTAVLEYITAEILELTANATRDNKKRVLQSRYLMLAIKHDEELSKLAKNLGWDILGGGEIPNIYAALSNSRPKYKKKTKTSVKRKRSSGSRRRRSRSVRRKRTRSKRSRSVRRKRTSSVSSKRSRSVSRKRSRSVRRKRTRSVRRKRTRSVRRKRSSSVSSKRSRSVSRKRSRSVRCKRSSSVRCKRNSVSTRRRPRSSKRRRRRSSRRGK